MYTTPIFSNGKITKGERRGKRGGSLDVCVRIDYHNESNLRTELLERYRL